MKHDVSSALVSHIDMFATFAALVGQQLPDNAAPDSENQLKAWTGKDKKGRDYLIEQAGSLSVIQGDWKYISPSKGAAYSKWTDTELGNNPDPQLYNLKLDIGERNNIAPDNADKVKALNAIIEHVRNTPEVRKKPYR